MLWSRLFSLSLLLSTKSQVLPFVDIASTHSYGSVFTFSPSDDAQYLFASQASTVAQMHTSNVEAGWDVFTSFQHIPTTIIHFENSMASTDHLESQIETYEADDVWRTTFLLSLVLTYNGRIPAKFDSGFCEWLKKKQVRYLFLAGSFTLPCSAEQGAHTFRIQVSGPLLQGPYILTPYQESHSTLTTLYHLSFHAVYRLYLDIDLAFMFGAIPNLEDDGGWIATNLTQFSEAHMSEDDVDPEPGLSQPQLIPVPSRISSLTPSSRNANTTELSGLRFALKDLFDVKGLPTSGGSMAYLLTHPIPNVTAPSVARLLDQGAILVGKTRTSQFAHGAQPWEFQDFAYSWSARADGFLTAASSSSGSACAIAGYDWLEFTVGSDTRGSVRKPAALVGAYGIRSSWGSMDMEGVLPLSEEMDTIGIFGRDPDLFLATSRLWYSDSPVHLPRTRHDAFPKKLLYPIEHFPIGQPQAQLIVDGFIQSLEHHLGIIKIPVDMTALVSPFFPNQSFPQFQLASNRLAEYRSWVSVGRPTTEAYRSKYGTNPTFDPVPERMFARAQSISEEDFRASVEMKRQFSRDLASHVFKHDAESCSDSIFVYEGGSGGKPSYRVKEYNGVPNAKPFLLTAPLEGEQPEFKDFFNFLASMGELPEVTIPIGQVEYRNWLRPDKPVDEDPLKEYVPVAIQVVARKGCDWMLLDLVRILWEKGVVRGVKTGKVAF